VIGFMHHLMHLPHIYNFYWSWGMGIDGTWILLQCWT
jgi:hypothetical protein